MNLATRADELTSHADPKVIDTLARCYFVNGDLRKAIELQKRAVKLSNPKRTWIMQKTLDEYEARIDKT